MWILLFQSPLTNDINMDYEEDEDSAEASLAISNVLHKYGISSSIPRLIQSALYHHIFCFIISDTLIESRVDLRLIGSVGEGAVLLLDGSSCDLDIMLILSDIEAYEHADVIVSPQHLQLQMEPCESNSGYVKLKVIKEGTEFQFFSSTSLSDLIINDATSNIRYLQNTMPVFAMSYLEKHLIPTPFHQISPIEGIAHFIAGPSFSRQREPIIPGVDACNKIDHVMSISCPTWPSVAVEWVKRKRDYGWPPKQFILEHERQGCYVVPVWCKKCERSDLDWRLSFVLVEKALVSEFNKTQLNCLLLLKQLKTFLFQKHIGDIISSYILKTTVFWMIEESPPDLWVPYRLLTIVQMCLDRLLSFVQDDFCPNYFIRTCNLLATRYTPSEKAIVIQTCLRARQNTRALLCQTPPFQEAFRFQRMEELATPIVEFDMDERDIRNMISLCNCMMNCPLDPLIRQKLSVQQTLSTTITYCKRTFLQLRKMLPKHDILQQYAATVKKRYGLMYIRFVWTNFYLRAQNNKHRYRCIRVLEFTEMNDLIEAVTICHLNMAVGNYTISNETLQMFISKFKVLPYNRMHLHGVNNDHITELKYRMVSKIVEMILNESGLYMQSITDILFSRFEIDLLPPPMQMEMCSNQNYGDYFDFSSGLSSTVAVDPLVYACFLRFWCWVKLDQNIEKLKARDDMVWCCGLPDITNKAVAFNLLGFCHKHLYEYDEAFRAFCIAWNQDPRSDATLIHISVLVNTAIRRELNGTSLN